MYRVEDNGMGIAERHLSEVFEVFRRLDPAATQGEGLGLAITRTIAERHRGKMWIESRVNEGTTVFVTLPFFFVI